MSNDSTIKSETALITGAAKRIGAAIASRLHAEGMNIALHYNHSEREAQALQRDLEAARPDSVSLHRHDLLDPLTPEKLIEEVVEQHGCVHTLVNNASSFFSTPIGGASESDWDDLLATNLKAPFFISQAAAPYLQRRRGCIVNMADIYGLRPLPGHAVYNMAKAGLVMMTQSLALDLAPDVRVNAIAPGPILWPSSQGNDEANERIVQGTPLARRGDPHEVADSVLFLVKAARFTTGMVLTVDGGRRVAGY